jgi:transposase
LEIAHKSNSLRNEIPREKKIERAIELRKEGRSEPQIAEWLGISKATAHRWTKGFAPSSNEEPAKSEGADGKEYPAEKPSDTELVERRQKVKQLREQGEKAVFTTGGGGVSEK